MPNSLVLWITKSAGEPWTGPPLINNFVPAILAVPLEESRLNGTTLGPRLPENRTRGGHQTAKGNVKAPTKELKPHNVVLLRFAGSKKVTNCEILMTSTQKIADESFGADIH